MQRTLQYVVAHRLLTGLTLVLLSLHTLHVFVPLVLTTRGLSGR